MRKTIFKGLTGLLIPFAAYAAPIGYGSYQRRQPVSAVSHQTLSDAVRPYSSPVASTLRVADGNGLAITSGTTAKELVIIDAAVPDKHVLYRAAKPGVEFVEIIATEPGLAQLTRVLARYKNLSALHIVSHARAGELLLGDSRITADDIKHEVGTFSALNGALREGGDLLLYGCDLAAGDAGVELLEVIQGNTHLDVAASSDKTGSHDLRGDWELEISAGDIEAELPFSDKALKDFSAILAAPSGTYGFEDDWTEVGNTLSSTHFIVGAKDINTTTSLNVSIYSAPPFPAYIQNGHISANNYFYVNADGIDTGSFELTALTAGEYATGQFTNVRIVGILRDNSQITSSTINGNSGTSGENFNFGAGQLANFSGVQLKAFKLYFDTTSAFSSTVPFFEFRSFTVANAQNPADSDGSLVAAAGVTEPVGLATTVDTVGEAVNVFDFRISDGGTNDSYALTVSQLFINVSGTSTDTERGKITWRLNGPDASNVAGTYSAATDRITFSGLNISVANGGNETYTVNAYYNDNTGLTEDRTLILSVDGDTNLTVGALGTQMASTSAVTNGTGTTVDVTATQLVFTTQPAGSVSGSALTTQPAVAARDAFGNTDVDFTETITLTEASAGTLSNNTQAATSGVATFTNLIYTATADQQSFTLTANDQDGVSSNLPTVDSDSVTSNVVATKLLFTTQPAPTTITSGVATSFTTVPIVSATDANNVVDTGYASGIVLSVTDPNDGTVDGTVNSLTGTGDTDGSGTTVTLTASSGVATYTGLQLTYTAASMSDTIALRTTSGGLTAANSSNIAVTTTPIVTAGNISISGASGTGGVYKIGDTVTATWNNTAGGDNNAGISGVTVDFSQFGGGAAVAATESSGTWTATYTIVSGAIDAANRNVSVTATNAAGSTTMADTANATVDNIAPTVTDARISISGASGTGGAFKIGDTVTATWNNTAGGDNNSDTISSVTVNFSQFGGGAAVAASNSSGTWTATYTIVSGAIDATSRNVSATATDNAGNATTTADTTNATVDNVVPTVTNSNISISGASGTGGTFVTGDTVTATWNNTAGGDNNSDTIGGVTVDFSQFGGGAAVAASNSSGTWTATYTIVSGAIDAANRNVSVTATDNAGNATTTADTTNATVDNAGPTVTDARISISGASGTGGAYKTGDTVTATWNNTAGGDNNSDTISGVTVNFTQFGGGAAVAASNSSGTWTASYTITSGAIDAVSRNVTVSATDNAGNGTTTADTTNATVDNQAPTVTNGNISISGASGTGGVYKTGDTVTATWDNTAGGDNNSDTISGVTVNFTQFGGGAAVAASNSSGTWTATYTIVSGSIDASNRNISVTANDNAGNDTTTADTTGATVDNIAPTVTDGNISISGASGTGGAFIVGDTVTATWNNTAGGDNNSDTISNVTVNFSQFGGGAAVAATNSSGTWTATYTIVAGSIDATNRNVSVTATDNAGNGTTTADSSNAAVDNEAASAGSVNLPANGTYGEGDDLDFTVNYSEAVTVSGTPRLVLTIGSTTRHADYQSGTGGTALVFRYTVQAGDNDANGIALSNTLSLNGGALTDGAGNDAGTSLGAIGSLASVLVDTQGPGVSSVGLPADGTYAEGDNLDFTINFGEAVTVNTTGGTPRLGLTVGLSARNADYISGSSTGALVFRYTVVANDNDSDGIEFSATTFDPNGGTLQDALGNDALTDLGTIGSLASVLVDTQAPEISANTGLNVTEGESGTISDTRLEATDNVSAAGEITFTVIAVPVNGALLLNGGELSNGNTFKQDDIDNDRVTYEHDGSATSSDSFDFNVRDAVDNIGANDTFTFNITPPEEPAITAPADLDIDATGLYTTVTLRRLLGLAANASNADVEQARLALASDAADGPDCCNPVALELNNGRIRLRPGSHEITWRAIDSDGNTSEDTQIVNIHPRISFGKDQMGVEGGQVMLRIMLNGPAPVYPLDVPYEINTAAGSADNADHDLVDGQVQFNAGETEQSVTINLADSDGAEGNEVLVVRLGDGINAGAADRHRITITEGNVAPAVTLSLEQNSVDTTLVTPVNGMVTATVTVNDPNSGDTHDYDWSMSDAALIDSDGDSANATFVFNPLALDEGVLRLHVMVNDGTAMASAALSFRVVEELPVLGASDTDGDTVDDQTEGAGDNDGDGIPDYLDNIGAANVLPETAARTDAYLIECDPGIRCRLGSYALLGSNGAAYLSPADLSSQEIPADEGYEHIGGIFDFQAQGLPEAGQSVRVVIPLRAAIPAEAVYRKFQNDQWNTFVEDARNELHSAPGEAGYCPPPGDALWQSGLQAGDRCIQLTIEDGGPNDADGSADASIADPGSVASQDDNGNGTGGGGGGGGGDDDGNGGGDDDDDDETVVVYGVRSKVKGGGGSADGLFLVALVLLSLMRRRHAGKAVAAGLLLALPAQQAQALDWSSLLENSYVELGISQAEGSRSRGELIDGLADDDVEAAMRTYDVSRQALQLHFGYQYGERFAVRFGYLDLGDVTVDFTARAASDAVLSRAISRNYPASADGWVLANRFEYPVYGRLSLAVDAGIYHWDSKIDLTDLNGRDINADIDGDTDPILGLGANYRFGERYSVGLNWQRVLFSNEDVDMWGLSGSLHFRD